MTYGQLYSKVTGWTARHIAQDMYLMYGENATASAYDIDRILSINEKENAGLNKPHRKREANGRYDYEGDWDRLSRPANPLL